MNGNMISADGHHAEVSMPTNRYLTEIIGDTFKQAVANKLDGKVPELIRAETTMREHSHLPVLTFLIYDGYSGTGTRVEIAVGRSKPEEGIYYAWMGRDYEPKSDGNYPIIGKKDKPEPEDYQEFSSPGLIGEEAAKAFRHAYLQDIIGI
jgi:hypothetical protein